MDRETQQKWDAASRTLDLFAFADDRRLGPHKQRLFSKIRGATLMVAAGTGADFKFFPPNLHLVAIDISPKMLERAAGKAAAYSGSIELREMDVCALDFPDCTFDTVATACTFCSVPRPVVGLRELYRVLKPGGQMLMFEQTVVTAAVKNEAAGVAGVEFVPLGRRALKGIAGEIDLFAVVAQGAQESPERRVDPVCGIEVRLSTAVARLVLDGQEQIFCCATCLQRFVEAPERYRPAAAANEPGKSLG